MATVTYPLGLLVDDSGAILNAPVVTITSVVDKSGSAVASHGATVNGSASATPISVDYDAEAKVEAWITLSVSQSGKTITGTNATIALYAARDSGRIDAAISSRSTYAGADPAGVTQLLTRLTNTRATNLDNLDAAISSRLASASYTAAPTAAAVATQVDATLSGSHGAGAWTGSGGSGSSFGFPVVLGSTSTAVQLTVPTNTPSTGWTTRKLFHVATEAEAAILSVSIVGMTATLTLGTGWPTPTAGDIAIVRPSTS